MRAIFSPGPAYTDDNVIKYAGWHKILVLMRESLEELGLDTGVVVVPKEVIDQTCTVSKILSYDIYAAHMLRQNKLDDTDLFIGPPGYSNAQMLTCRNAHKMLYVWNNADWWRDQQLAAEYKDFGVGYDLSPAWRIINVSALNYCDSILSCSPFVSNTHAKVAPGKPIDEAFWGVDSQRFSPPDKPAPGFRVLFVGGDPIRKGLRYLLMAMQGLEGAELWVVGSDVKLEGLPVKTKTFGMVPNDQMPEIYRQCHVQVCPTLEDGIALCVQEGMASGCVPIASPDAAEVFDDGRSGFKVDFRDVKAIHEAISKLQKNPVILRTMSLAARQKAQAQTWDEFKSQFRKIVADRLAEHSRIERGAK